MTNSLLYSAITVCLIAQCTLAQYQTAPAYGSGYQQQRKMAPNPKGYGDRQAGMSGYGNTGAMDMQMQEMANPMMGGGYESAGMASDSGSNNNNNNYGKQQQAAMSNGSGYGAKQQHQQQQTTGQQMAGYGKQAAAKYEQEPEHPPMPFAWGYDINDGYGASQYHKENGDEYGKRTGSYGYMDAYGVYRHVNYVADENGFRATVKTNEPGTANESPADVELHAEEPPANVFMGNKDQSGYGSSSASSSYGGGSSSLASDSGSNSQYGQSGQSGQSAGNGVSSGRRYGSSNGGAMETAGKQYGQSSTMSGAAASDSSSYGSGSGAMMMMNPMAAAGGRQQYNGATGSGGMGMGTGVGMSMPSMMAGGRQQYGGGMKASMGMMKIGQGSYGGSSSQMSNSAENSMPMSSQYGTSMLSSMMNAGMAKARRYNGNNGASKSNGAKQAYGSAATMMMGESNYGSQQQPMSMAAEMEGQQYGRSTMGRGASMQQYAGAASQQEQEIDSNAQQQYGLDSALAQQYGPSSMNSAQQQQQQYGGSNNQSPMMTMSQAMMDGTSTYSSMRLQPPSGARQMPSNGSSGYGSSMGPQQAGNMMMGGRYKSAQASQANNMDNYKKAAAKNIA